MKLIKTIISCCLFCLILITCKTISSNKEKPGIKAISLFNRISMLNGDVFEVDTTFILKFTDKELVLYQLTYIHNDISRDTMKTERRYHYFVYSEGNKYGYDYDIHKSPDGIKTTIDSIFENEWCAQNKLAPIFGETNEVKLISRYLSKNKDTLKESYFIKNKAGMHESATVSAEYVRSLKDLDFTLSRELDSLRKMKLHRFIYKGDPIKINDTLTFKNIGMSYEINKADDSDRQKLAIYFQRYRAEKPVE